MNIKKLWQIPIFVVLNIANSTDAIVATCPSDLVSLHDEYITQYKSDMQNEAASGISSTYYFTSYYLHGMISAIECTRNMTELALLVSLIDIMISKSQDTNSDGIYEWPPLANGRPIQLNTWQTMSAIARAASFIMNDATFRPTYGAKAQSWISFIHKDTIDLWYKRVYGEQIPYVEWGIADSNPSSWNDKATHFLTIMAFLYRATGNAYYRDIAIRGGNAFKKRLKLNGNGWVWDNDAALGVPDTSHANREPMWVVFMYEMGLVFTENEVVRMGYTLGDIIWNQSTSSPLFSNYINGSNTTYETATAWRNGTIYLGWALTGRYNSKAQTSSRAMLDFIVAGGSNESAGTNASSYGKIALTGHLIRNSLSSPTATNRPSAPMNLKVLD